MLKRQPVHIFIVDNSNKIFVKMLDYIFTKEYSYRFFDFKTAYECLSNLHLNPNVIVLDYEMPDMKGEDILKHIKESNPDTNVIVFLGESDSSKASQLLSEGASDYVWKENQGVGKIIEKLEQYFRATS